MNEHDANDLRNRPAIWQGVSAEQWELGLIGKAALEDPVTGSAIFWRLDKSGRAEYDAAVERGWLWNESQPTETWYVKPSFAFALRAQLLGLPLVHVAGRLDLGSPRPRTVCVSWAAVRGFLHLSEAGLGRFEAAFREMGPGPFQASYGLNTNRSHVPHLTVQDALDTLAALAADASNVVCIGGGAPRARGKAAEQPVAAAAAR